MLLLKVRAVQLTTLLMLQLLKDATESRRKCELMKEQETQLKQQVNTHTVDRDSEFIYCEYEA